MQPSSSPLLPPFCKAGARLAALFCVVAIAFVAVYATPLVKKSAVLALWGHRQRAAKAIDGTVPAYPEAKKSDGRLIIRSVVQSQNGSVGPAAARRQAGGAMSALVPLSRLDEVGRLAQPIPVGGALAWRQELHAAACTPERAARLHLWLGEVDLAVNEAPGDADWHFRQSMHLAPRSDRAWGAAAVDRGLVQFAVGDYEAARADFGRLIDRKTGAGVRGISRANCALWMRHASACLGYHAQLGALGIPRPARLDPLCGAGGLAACLRAMHRPYDKAAILKACRVTGRGSNALDLLKACPKLGVIGRFVTADDKGLKLLPKPCIAYVEHDHFVTVLRADADGIAYLCTDCGAWPGGEVSLDWKQWHALEATGYITVTRKGSAAEDRLSRLPVSPQSSAGSLATQTASRKTAGVQVASLARNVAFAPSTALTTSTAAAATARLAHHVSVLAMRRQGVYGIYFYQDSFLTSVNCGFNPDTLQCICPISCPDDSMSTANITSPGRSLPIYPLPTPGHPPLGHGLLPVAPPRPPNVNNGVPAPGSGDPVNLSTLEEEYEPSADLAVYNPHGPSVHWHRTYETLRGDDPAYEYDDFGSGWSQGYNFAVYDAAPAGMSAPTNSSQVPQAGSAGSVPVTGTLAPLSSANVWEIYDGSTLVAYSPTWAEQGIPAGGSPEATTEDGWSVSKSFGRGPVTSFGIGAPAWAQIGAGYTVRTATVPGSGSDASATFSVVSPLLQPASSGTKYIEFPNGSRVSFTNSAVPSAGTPTVSCAVQHGAPYLVTLCYDPNDGTDYYTVTFSDQTTLRTANGFVHGGTLYYPISSLSDRVGNKIDFVYAGGPGLNSGLPILTQINDDSTGSALLTISRSGTSSDEISSVSDCYGRSVYYQTSWHANSGVPDGYPQGQYELDQVSQIVATGASSPAMRAQLGYILSNNTEGAEQVNYLHTITTPSPTGTGTATATINYDTEYGCFVSNIVDANGNIHQYVPVDANHTQVLFENPAGTVIYSHTVGFNSDMSQTTDTDGQVNGSGANTHVMYTKAFSDPYDPYRPSSLTDAAGRTTSYTWDANGHMQTLTDVVGTVTTNTWDYTTFPLGRMTSTQRGSKPATTAT